MAYESGQFGVLLLLLVHICFVWVVRMFVCIEDRVVPVLNNVTFCVLQ